MGDAVLVLSAIGLNCSLSRAETPSSTRKLLEEVGTALEAHRVSFDIVHVRDVAILPGVTSDEGPGDQWPSLRARILAADMLVLGTPIWLGQPSSLAKRVVERMDAFLTEIDERKRMPSYGKVAGVAVVGNEDGAHHVGAEMYQALNDVGFTLAANATTYWVGEAMGKKNYVDLDSTPKSTNDATSMMVRNMVHLSRLLKRESYPGEQQG